MGEVKRENPESAVSAAEVKEKQGRGCPMLFASSL